MSALVEEVSFVPARTLPGGKAFWSECGLFDFQAQGAAEAYLRTEPGGQSGVVAVWDTGIGKTFLAMALATMLFEDDQIDLVMVIAEKNKITEWRDDIARHTTLQEHRYHGTGRQNRLAKAGVPHVFITTYETGRNELLALRKVPGHRTPQKVDGPLVDTLGLRGKRVLWIFDEVPKLRTRSSQAHKAYDYILRELRKGPHHQRVLGLTGTPMERDFEDAYNVGRIVCPEKMPTVAQFEETFTNGRDPLYGNYRFKPGREHVFGHLFRSIVLRKRKTDPDVIEQFPQQVEETIWVDLKPDHAEFYQAVGELLDPTNGQADDRSERQVESDTRRMWGLQRMTAGHPAAHLHAQNELSQVIAATMGEQVLRSIAASKIEPLLEKLRPIVFGQGDQAVVFTFYGSTVLKELVRELEAAKFSVVQFHGARSLKQNDEALALFKDGGAQVLVLSDAGSRGIGLQNARYVVEFEAALTHANRIQRINRVHRISSKHASVTCYTMILSDTIEEGIMGKVMKRNEQQDLLLGDEEDGTGFISADERREMLRITRSGRRRR